MQPSDGLINSGLMTAPKVKKKNDKKRQISESTSSKYSFKYYATFTNKTVYKIEVLSQRNSIRP